MMKKYWLLLSNDSNVLVLLRSIDDENDNDTVMIQYVKNMKTNRNWQIEREGNSDNGEMANEKWQCVKYGNVMKWNDDVVLLKMTKW